MELTERRRQEVAYLLLSKLADARDSLRHDASRHEEIESGSGLSKGELSALLSRLEKQEAMTTRDAESALALLIYTSGVGGTTPSAFTNQQVASVCGIELDEFRAFNQAFKAVQFGAQLCLYRVRDLCGKHVYISASLDRWKELGLSSHTHDKQPMSGSYAIARAVVTGVDGVELDLGLHGNPQASLDGIALRAHARDLLTAGGKGYYRTDEDHGPLTLFA